MTTIAPGFDDLQTFFDPDLKLPVGGRVYRIPCPSARDGLVLRARMLSGQNISDTEELAMLRQLCGETWDELMSSQPWPVVVHAARTGLVYYGYGPESAERFWEEGLQGLGNPLPPPPVKVRVAGALRRLRDGIRPNRVTTETGTPAADPGSDPHPEKNSPDSP